MKYNVGDKVVKESDLEILFNPYWKKEKRQQLIKTVTEATENHFAIYNDKGRYKTTLEKAFSCGMDNYLAYYQKSGLQMSSREKMLHLEKDKELITSIMENDGATQFNDDTNRAKKEIERLKETIKRLEKEYDNDLIINRKLLNISEVTQ